MPSTIEQTKEAILKHGGKASKHHPQTHLMCCVCSGKNEKAWLSLRK